MGQIAESILNHNIKRNVGHHHMFVITCTLTNEDCQKHYMYPIFRIFLKMFKKQHKTLLRNYNQLQLFHNINF